MALRIGLDIGWSPRRRSCAIAFAGLSTDDPLISALDSPVWYEDRVCAARFRLADLCALAPKLGQRVVESGAVLVIDAPLGTEGPPHHDRAVDGWFRRGAFAGRVQPQRVTSDDGQRLVDAAYAFLLALGTPATVLYACSESAHPLAVFETNPTVGLALLVPKQPIAELPSRKRPKVDRNGRTVRAKSDWYWSLGAGRRIADILSAPSVSLERDHERVAGLYCLSVAVALSGRGSATSGAVTAGDRDGIYALPDRVDSSWARDVAGFVFSGSLRGTCETTVRYEGNPPNPPQAPKHGCPTDDVPARTARPNPRGGCIFRCPIAGCTKVFHGTRGGWDEHAGSIRTHPGWHPELLDRDERKGRFRAEFPDFFSAGAEHG